MAPERPSASADGPPREAAATTGERPFVSVVVPVYNDPEGIRSTLDSLVGQSAPADRYEVVVVDNGSTDETRAVVREYRESAVRVRLLVEDEIQGSYAARNRGIRAATGPVIAFVDADMLVAPDWIESVARAMSDTDVEYLGCAVTLFTAGDEGVAAKYNRLNDLHVERFVEELAFAPTCSLVVRRSLLEELGGFDPRIRSGGDMEFGNRVAAAGRRLRYAPDLTVYHPTRTTLVALLGKARRVGRGKTQLRRHYPGRYHAPIVGALNPGEFLPPRPSAVRRAIRDWTALPLLQKIIFYLLTYVTSLAKAAGQLLELVAPTDPETDSGPPSIDET